MLFVFEITSLWAGDVSCGWVISAPEWRKNLRPGESRLLRVDETELRSCLHHLESGVSTGYYRVALQVKPDSRGVAYLRGLGSDLMNRILVDASTAESTSETARAAYLTDDFLAGVWEILHPEIVELARPRYEAGHYADAVEVTLKHFNARVKEVSGETHRDGADLMRNVFSVNNPILLLGDVDTPSGRDVQQGYMELFVGGMIGIRNPKAHDNISIDAVRAVHFLFVASLFLDKLAEASPRKRGSKE